MVVLDEDFGTNLTLVEGNGGVRLAARSSPMLVGPTRPILLTPCLKTLGSERLRH